MIRINDKKIAHTEIYSEIFLLHLNFSIIL